MAQEYLSKEYHWENWNLELECSNKSDQVCIVTHFNDLYILTRVSKYTEISQADISNLKPVQIFSQDTKLHQLSQLQNLL